MPRSFPYVVLAAIVCLTVPARTFGDPINNSGEVISANLQQSLRTVYTTSHAYVVPPLPATFFPLIVDNGANPFTDHSDVELRLFHYPNWRGLHIGLSTEHTERNPGRGPTGIWIHPGSPMDPDPTETMVPEAVSLLLLGTGLLGVVGAVRRKWRHYFLRERAG